MCVIILDPIVTLKNTVKQGAPDTPPRLQIPYLEGPNLEKNQDLGTRLKFSSEIETNDIFKRD